MTKSLLFLSSVFELSQVQGNSFEGNVLEVEVEYVGGEVDVEVKYVMKEVVTFFFVKQEVHQNLIKGWSSFLDVRFLRICRGSSS